MHVKPRLALRAVALSTALVFCGAASARGPSSDDAAIKYALDSVYAKVKAARAARMPTTFQRWRA